MSLGVLTTLFTKIHSVAANIIDPSGVGSSFGMLFSWVGSWIVQSFCSAIYALVKWLLAFVDFMQYFVQKLIGLDYWLNRSRYTLEGAIESDLIFGFLYNDTVQKVFRAMVAIFFVLLIIVTIYAIIKSEWEHIAGKGGKFGDGVGNSKTKIFKNSIKAIALVLIFPTILMIGVISANAILASLIKALNIDTSSTLGGQLFQIGSQTANKYEIYAHGEEGRNAVSDQVVFYVYNHNGKDKYLSLSSVGTSTDTVYNVKTYEQYLELASKSTRYVVNSVFTKINCEGIFGAGNVRNFYGYIAKLTDEPFFIAALVNPEAEAGEVNSKQAMYHYLHNVLQVPIVTPNKSYGFVETKEIKDAAQFNNDGYITNLDLAKFYNNKKGYDMVSACYNTWNYASVYAKTFAFENSVNYSVVRSGTRLPVKFEDLDSDGTVDANEKVIVGGSLSSGLEDYTVYDAASGGQVNPSLLQALNLGQVTSAKVLYNSDYVAPYFDGGQKDGIVQLQSEYLVMAEVINFINQNNFRLHILDITSDLIDWSGEGDHVIEDRWISMDGDKPRYIDIADGKTSDSANTNTKKTIPFIVSYSDQCNDTEMGNVLYTGARVANGNEINGAKYIMCIKVEGRSNAKYIPLVHNRTYTDPTTGMMYNFRSDYYNGNYHGVVLAKGLLDSDSLTNNDRGEPTYFKSGSDQMYGKDEPYYFDMEVVGAFNQFGETNATITNEEYQVESLSIGYSTESYSYDARVKQVPKTGGAEGETEASSKCEYQIFKVQNGEDIDESNREQVVTPSIDIIQNLRIRLNSDDGTVTASYAGQTTGNNYLYSFTAGDGKSFYFIVQVDSGTQTLNILTYNSGGSKWEIGTRAAKISVQTKTYKILYDYTTVDSADTDEKQESIINDATPNYFEYVKQIKDPTTEGSEVKSVYTTVDMFTLKEHELTCYFNITFNTKNDTIVKLSVSDGAPTITFADMHATTLGADDDDIAARGNDYYVQRSQSVRFNLYDFYTADVGGHMNADEYVPGTLKSYDATKESVADRITDTPAIDYDDKKNEDRFFYAKLDSTGFEFHYKDSYLHLYDGKKYVATIYKGASNDPDDSIDDIKELRYRTTYVYIDGKTYYNIRTQNSYADTTAMNTYYEQVQSSVSIQCVRAARGYTFLEADVACVSVIPWHWRWKWSICITTMADREESNYQFYLKDGIQFDYFFEGNNKLHTFYVPSEISYWIIVIASVLMIKVLGTAIWGVIKRIYEITLYFIAAPAVASTIPLDDGTRFDTSIIKPLIGKVFSTYGTMLGINVFFILLYPVKSLSQIFTAEDIATSNSYFLKNFMKGIGNYAWRANLLNLYVYILFVLVAFTMISAIPETISKMVGDGSDIGKMGAETKNAAVGKDGVLKQGMDFISGKSAMEKGKAAIDYVKETPIGKATGAVWNKIKQARDGVGSEDSGGDTGGKPPVENKKIDDEGDTSEKEAEIMQDINGKIAEKGGIKGSNGETYNTYEEAMASGDEEAMKQAQAIRGEVEAEIMAGDDEEKKKALENMKKREAGETGEEEEEEKTDNAEDAAKETFTENMDNVAEEMGGDAGKMKGNIVRNLAGMGNAAAGKIAGLILGKKGGDKGVQGAIFGDDDAGKQRKKDAILSTLTDDQKAEYEQAKKNGKEDEFLSQFEATAKVGEDGQVQMAVKRVKDAAGNAIAEADQKEVAVGAETANQMIGAMAQNFTDDEVKEAVDSVSDPEEKAALEKGLATAATENLAAAMSGDAENDSITEQVVRDVMERPEDEKNGKVIDQAIFDMLQADPEALKAFKKVSGLNAEQMKDPEQVMQAISKLRDGKAGIEQLGITPDHYKKFVPGAVQKAVQSGDYKLDAWELFNRNDPKKAREYIEAESAKKLQRSNEEAEYEAEKSKEVANGATPEQLMRVLAATGKADPEKVAQMFDKFAGLDNMSPDQQKAVLEEINKIDPNLVANLKRSGKAETDLDVIKAYQAAMLLDGNADANNITALLEQSKNNPQAFANDILNGMLEHSDKGNMAGVLEMMGGKDTIFTEDEINGLKDQYAANGYLGLSKDEQDKLAEMGISADAAQNMSAFEIQGLLNGHKRSEDEILKASGMSDDDIKALSPDEKKKKVEEALKANPELANKTDDDILRESGMSQEDIDKLDPDEKKKLATNQLRRNVFDQIRAENKTERLVREVGKNADVSTEDLITAAGKSEEAKKEIVDAASQRTRVTTKEDEAEAEKAADKAVLEKQLLEKKREELKAAGKDEKAIEAELATYKTELAGKDETELYAMYTGQDKAAVDAEIQEEVDAQTMAHLKENYGKNKAFKSVKEQWFAAHASELAGKGEAEQEAMFFKALSQDQNMLQQIGFTGDMSELQAGFKKNKLRSMAIENIDGFDDAVREEKDAMLEAKNVERIAQGYGDYAFAVSEALAKDPKVMKDAEALYRQMHPSDEEGHVDFDDLDEFSKASFMLANFGDKLPKEELDRLKKMHVDENATKGKSAEEIRQTAFERITENPEKFRAVYDFMTTVDASEGANKVAADLKDGIIRDQIKEYQKQGIEISTVKDPDTMDPEERKKYEHRQSILQAELRGKPEIIANLFKNHTTIGQDKIVADIAATMKGADGKAIDITTLAGKVELLKNNKDFMARYEAALADPANAGKNKYDILKEMANNATIEDLKGGLDNSKIVEYMNTHEDKKNELVALGAQDIMTALDKDSQDMKKVDAVLSSTYLRNQVADDVLKEKLGENVDKDLIKELIKQMLKAEGREDQANDEYIEKHMSELKTELALHDITKVIKDKDGNVTGAELGGRNTDAFIASMQKLEKENGTFATNLNRDVTRIIDPANYDPETSSQQFFEVRTVDEFRAREETPIQNMGDAIDAYNKKGFKWFSKKTRLASSGADDEGTTTGSTENAETPQSKVKRHMKYDGTARTAENFDIYEKAKNDKTVVDALKAQGKEINYDNIHEYLAQNKDKQQELQGQVYAEAMIKEAKATGMSAEKFKEKFGVEYNEDITALGQAVQESEKAQKAASKLEAKGDKDFAARMLADPETQKKMKREMVSDVDLVKAYEERNGEIAVDTNSKEFLDAARNDEYIKARLGENASDDQIKEFLADKKNKKQLERITTDFKANAVKNSKEYDATVNAVLYKQGKLDVAPNFSADEIVEAARYSGSAIMAMSQAGVDIKNKDAVKEFLQNNPAVAVGVVQELSEQKLADGEIDGSIKTDAFNKHYDQRHGAQEKRFKAAEALREKGEEDKADQDEAETKKSKLMLWRGKFAAKNVENVKLFNELNQDEAKREQVKKALEAQGKEYNYDNVMLYLATKDDGNGGVSEGWNIRKELQDKVRKDKAKELIAKEKGIDVSEVSDDDARTYLAERKNARKVDSALRSTNKEAVAEEVRKSPELFAEAYKNSVTDNELKDYMKKNPSAVAEVKDDDADYIAAIQNDAYLKARFGGKIDESNIEDVKKFLDKNPERASALKEKVQLTRARNNSTITTAIINDKVKSKVNSNVTDSDVVDYVDKHGDNVSVTEKEVMDAAKDDPIVKAAMQAAGATDVKEFLKDPKNKDLLDNVTRNAKIAKVKQEVAKGEVATELKQIKDARVAKETKDAENGIVDSYMSSKKRQNSQIARGFKAFKEGASTKWQTSRGVKALNKEVRKEKRAERWAKGETFIKSKFNGYSTKNLENIEMFKALEDDSMSTEKAEIEAALKAEGKEYNYQNVMKYLSNTKNAKAWDTRKKLTAKVKDVAAEKLYEGKKYEDLSASERKKVDAHLKSKDKEVVGAAIKGTSLETEAVMGVVTDADIDAYLQTSGRVIETTEADRIAAAKNDAKIKARLGADINDDQKVREFLMLNADEAARMDKQAKINKARKDVTAMKGASAMKFRASDEEVRKYQEFRAAVDNEAVKHEMEVAGVDITDQKAVQKYLETHDTARQRVDETIANDKTGKYAINEAARAVVSEQKKAEAVDKYYTKKQYQTPKRAKGETFAKFQGKALRFKESFGKSAMERIQNRDVHAKTFLNKHKQRNIGNIEMFKELEADSAKKAEVEAKLQAEGKEYNFDNVMEFLAKEENSAVRSDLSKKVRFKTASTVLADDAEYQQMLETARNEALLNRREFSDEDAAAITDQYLAKNRTARNKVTKAIESTNKSEVNAAVKGTSLETEAVKGVVSDAEVEAYVKSVEGTDKAVTVTEADRIAAAQKDAKIRARLGDDINDEKKVREFLMLNTDEAARMEQQAKVNKVRKNSTTMNAIADAKFRKQVSGKDALDYANKHNVTVKYDEMVEEAAKMTGYAKGSKELDEWLKDTENVVMARDAARSQKVMADETAMAELTAQKKSEAVNKFYNRKQYKTHRKAGAEVMAKLQGTALRFRDSRGKTAMERLQNKETHVNTKRGKHAQGNVGNIMLFNELDGDADLRKEIELQLQNSGKEYNYDNVMEYLSKEGNAEIRGELAKKVRVKKAKEVLKTDAGYQATIKNTEAYKQAIASGESEDKALETAMASSEADDITLKYMASHKSARTKVSAALNSTNKENVAAEVKKNTRLVQEAKNASVSDDAISEFLTTNKIKVSVDNAEVIAAARGDAYIMGRLKKSQKVTNADVVAEARKNTALMSRVAESKTVSSTEIRNTVRDNKEYLTKLGLSENASSAEIDAALNKTENRKIRESIERDIKIKKVTDEDINQHFATHESERANFEEQAQRNKKVSDADIDAFLRENAGDREKLETQVRVDKARNDSGIMRRYHEQNQTISDDDILEQMKKTGKSYTVSDADIEKAAMGQADVVKQMNDFLNKSPAMKKRYGLKKGGTVADIKDPKMRAEFMKNFFGQNKEVKENLTTIAQIAKAREDSTFMDTMIDSGVSDADITKFMGKRKKANTTKRYRRNEKPIEDTFLYKMGIARTGAGIATSQTIKGIGAFVGIRKNKQSGKVEFNLKEALASKGIWAGIKYTGIGAWYGMKGVGKGGAVAGKGIGHVFALGAQGVAFKTVGKLPKMCAQYENWNRVLNHKITQIKNDTTLTRAEKEKQIKIFESQKIYLTKPAAYKNMSPEEQNAFDLEQDKLKRAAYTDKNLVKYVKSLDRMKKHKGNAGAEFAGGLTYDSTKGMNRREKHLKDYNDMNSQARRFKATAAMRDMEKDFGDDFEKFARSFLSKKRYFDMIRRYKIKNAIEYQKLNAREKEKERRKREEALAAQISRINRVLAKKVAKDKKIDKKSFLAQNGYTDDLLRYKPGYNKFNQNQDQTTKLSRREVKERRQAAEAIHVQSYAASVDKMMQEFVKFSSTYKGPSSNFADELKKYAAGLGKQNEEMINKIYKKYANMFRGGLGRLENSPVAVQQKKIMESFASELRKCQQRVTSKGKIPSSAEMNNMFVGRTFTGATTKAEVALHRQNAEELSRLVKLIKDQKNLISYESLRSRVSSTFMADFERNNPNINKKSEQAKKTMLESYFTQKLNEALKKVHNDNYQKSDKNQLERLNGRRVKKSEIDHSKVSPVLANAMKTADNPVYQNIVREFKSATEKVKNEQFAHDELVAALNRFRQMPRTPKNIGKTIELQKAVEQSKVRLRTLNNILTNAKNRKADFERAFASTEIKEAKASSRVRAYNSSVSVMDKYTFPKRDGTVIEKGTQDAKQVQMIVNNYVQAHRQNIETMLKNEIIANNNNLRQYIDGMRSKFTADFGRNMRYTREVKAELKKYIEKLEKSTKVEDVRLREELVRRIGVIDQAELILERRMTGMNIDIANVKLRK